MELPVKLDLPKLSHSDLLVAILPVTPGVAILTNLFVAGVSPLGFLARLGLGYKTALVFCLCVSYVLGFALTQASDLALYRIATRIWPTKRLASYQDPFWRLLVGKLLPKEVLPSEIILSEEDARARADVIASQNEDARRARSEMQSSQMNTRKALEERRTSLENLPDSETKQALQAKLEELEARALANAAFVRAMDMASVRDYAWLQLDVALSSKTDVLRRYSGLDAALSAVQLSAAIQAFASWLVKTERAEANFLFSVSLVILVICTFGRWEIFDINRRLSELNIGDIGTALFPLLKEPAQSD